MTSDIQNRIAEMELRLPYFDKEALRSVSNLSDRYHLATIGADDRLAEKYQLDPNRLPDLIVCQIMAGMYIREQMAAKGIRAVEACELSGINKTMISKVMNGARPFSFVPSVVTPFCYNVLHESCHKVMFGEEGRIELPAPYSLAARALLGMEKSEREAQLRCARKQAELFDLQYRKGLLFPEIGKATESSGKKGNQNQKIIPNAPRRDQLLIIRERIQEFLDDTGRRPVMVLGQGTPPVIRNIMRRLLLDLSENPSPRLTILMYLSFETGLAMDYFIAEDFTKYVPCFYTDENGNRVELKDREVLQFIGTCAALPPETREKLIGKAIGVSLDSSKKT